jgi:hypothetical protein
MGSMKDGELGSSNAEGGKKTKACKQAVVAGLLFTTPRANAFWVIDGQRTNPSPRTIGWMTLKKARVK